MSAQPHPCPLCGQQPGGAALDLLRALKIARGYITGPCFETEARNRELIDAAIAKAMAHS